MKHLRFHSRGKKVRISESIPSKKLSTKLSPFCYTQNRSRHVKCSHAAAKLWQKILSHINTQRIRVYMKYLCYMCTYISFCILGEMCFHKISLKKSWKLNFYIPLCTAFYNLYIACNSRDTEIFHHLLDILYMYIHLYTFIKSAHRAEVQVHIFRGVPDSPILM